MGNFEVRAVNIEDSDHGINVYPNPTQEFVNVSAYQNYEIASIYDINGQLMKTESISGEVRIDLSDLDNGTYFVRVSSGSGGISEVMRVVKF